MSKHIELAKKLKALSEKGIGGEKITAEKMLNDLLKKHNITIDEIEGEKIQQYYFNIQKSDFKLWVQIVKKVNNSIKIYGEFNKKTIKSLFLEGNYMIKCTASEYVEIDAKNIFYKKLYSEELSIFYSAFLNANDLLVAADENDSKKEYTKEEIEKYKRASEMAQKIKKGQFLKQLSNIR